METVDDLRDDVDKVLEERSEMIGTNNCELSLVSAGLSSSESLTSYLGQGLEDETMVEVMGLEPTAF